VAKASLTAELQSFGALPSQLIDPCDQSLDSLAYLDFLHGDAGWQPPVIVHHDRVPRAYVFDGRDEPTEDQIDLWCRRIVLRGDPAWTAVLRPGRLDVMNIEESAGGVLSRSFTSHKRGTGVLADLIQDLRGGVGDLPQRHYLKDLLFRSMSRAVGYGLSELDAVSLVGWGLFWRFLVDRHLFGEKKPKDVADGAADWTSCLNTKGRALKTLAWLETTFNGGLLPFEREVSTFDSRVFSEVLGNIAMGATATGQLRLPSDWDQINFAHVPVGLLSEVYEAFATELDSSGAKSQSIHYTPRHIAEFVVAETLNATAVEMPCVLDPAAGAGVFLLATFRQLVEREWRRSNKRPTRRVIRSILSKQLTAFDVDARALRLAQLGLYLTAIELDPKPVPIEDLKFDAMDEALVSVDPVDGSLGPVDARFAGKFDVVIGNPPWTAKSKGLSAKKRWVRNTGAALTRRLGDRAEKFDFPDANPDLPFLWRAGEWAKPGGQIALVVHARWLFGISARSVSARRDIFTAFNVTGVLNGAALRQTEVWPNVIAPFCLVFARNERAPENGLFYFVSPYVESQDTKRQTVLRVEWRDAELVSHEEVRSVSWSLKARFRGDPLARRAFEQIRRKTIRLGDFLKKLKPTLAFKNGYQVGGAAGVQKSAKKLHGLPDLKDFAKDSFFLDPSMLPTFERRTLLRTRARSIYDAPLLLVRQTIPAEPLAPRSMRAGATVVFHESFHGLTFSGVAQGDDVSRYLQILLQSRMGPFASLMIDARYGVERDTIYKESLDEFPVIPFEKLTDLQRKKLRNVSHQLETEGLDDALFTVLNDFVFELYDLGNVERDAIVDTIETRGPTTESVQRSVNATTAPERALFRDTLKDSLNDVLQASMRSVTVSDVLLDVETPWRGLRITFDNSRRDGRRPSLAEIATKADAEGASLIVIEDDVGLFVGLPDRYRHWTRTQARLLASDLLSGTMGDA
jgi:hypothetical protein